jgi:hypothetical protein
MFSFAALWSRVIRETAMTQVSDLLFEKLHCLPIGPDELSDRQHMDIVLPHRAGYRNLVAGLCLVHPTLASLLGAVSSLCQCSTANGARARRR